MNVLHSNRCGNHLCARWFCFLQYSTSFSDRSEVCVHLESIKLFNLSTIKGTLCNVHHIYQNRLKRSVWGTILIFLLLLIQLGNLQTTWWLIKLNFNKTISIKWPLVTDNRLLIEWDQQQQKNSNKILRFTTKKLLQKNVKIIERIRTLALVTLIALVSSFRQSTIRYVETYFTQQILRIRKYWKKNNTDASVWLVYWLQFSKGPSRPNRNFGPQFLARYLKTSQNLRENLFKYVASIMVMLLIQ